MAARDVNCSQRIVPHYSEAEIAPGPNKLVARIKELEDEVARLKTGSEREFAFRRIALGGSPQESTRVWTGWMPMAQGFWAKSPRVHRHPPLKKHLVQGPGTEMPMPSGFQAQERQQAQHDHHHARDTARSHVEHLLRAMAGRKSRCFRTSNAGHCP